MLNSILVQQEMHESASSFVSLIYCGTFVMIFQLNCAVTNGKLNRHLNHCLCLVKWFIPHLNDNVKDLRYHQNINMFTVQKNSP